MYIHIYILKKRNKKEKNLRAQAVMSHSLGAHAAVPVQKKWYMLAHICPHISNTLAAH